MERTFFLTVFFVLTGILQFNQVKANDQLVSDYNLLAETYLDISLDSTIYFAKKSLATQSDRRKDYYSYYLMAYSYYAMNKLGLAVDMYLKSLDFIPEGKEYYYDKYSILNNLGEICHSLGNYSRAIEFYKKAISFVPVNEKQNLLYNLANSHRKNGDVDHALKILTNALSLSDSYQDTLAKIKVYGKMGLLYTDKKEFEVSRDYFEKVIHNFSSYKKYIGKSYHNIGNNYLLQNKYEASIPSFKEALNVKKTFKERYITLLDLGKSYLSLGQPKQALSYLLPAYDSYPKVKKIPDHIELLKSLEIAYFQLKNYEKSQLFSSQYHQDINDFIIAKNEINQKFSASWIEVHLNNRKILSEIENEKWNYYLGMTVLLLLLFVSIFLVIRSKLKFIKMKNVMKGLISPNTIREITSK